MEKICPNCGYKNTIRFFTPKTICCKKCKTTFTVEYEDENGEVHPGGFEGFKAVHPKITKAMKISGYVCVGAAVLFGIHGIVEEEIDKLTAGQGISEIPDFDGDDFHQTNVSSPNSNTEVPEECTSYETKVIPVNGCVVNLSSGRHASKEKRDSAAANGYDNLGESQTWRVNHDRNIKVPIEDND